MRIAYFTDTPEIGGAERYLADLAAGAQAAGHKVHLVAAQQEMLDFFGSAVRGAWLRQAGSMAYFDAPTTAARARALARALIELRSAFGGIGPDLLHVNNGGWPGSDLCRIAPLAGRLAGVPARLMTVHSMPWPRDHAQPHVQAVGDRVAWSSVHTVISPAHVVADALCEQRGLPPHLSRVVRYGVREPPGDPQTVGRLRRRLAPDGALLAGMVSASPSAAKGFDVFVDALAEAGEDVRGALVGRPPEDLPARIEERGIAERLALEGVTPGATEYFHAFDVLVVPSTAYECMPLVILEAMAAGTPVFGSRLSGIPEAIADGETGRVFTKGDSSALAALLRGAAADRPRLAQMGQAGRVRWEQTFSLAGMTSTTLELYEREVGPARGREKTANR